LSHGLDPVVKELVKDLRGEARQTTGLDSVVEDLAAEITRGRRRGAIRKHGKGKGKHPKALVSPEYAGVAEALTETPEQLLRTKAAGAEALEADTVRRGLVIPPGMPRTLAAAKQLLLTRYRRSCPGGRCLFREGENATQLTGTPRRRRDAFNSPGDSDFLVNARQVVRNSEALDRLLRREAQPYRPNSSVPRLLLLAGGDEAVKLRWRAVTNGGQPWDLQCGTKRLRHAPEPSVQVSSKSKRHHEPRLAY
jgi:hypothetical protein